MMASEVREVLEEQKLALLAKLEIIERALSALETPGVAELLFMIEDAPAATAPPLLTVVKRKA